MELSRLREWMDIPAIPLPRQLPSPFDRIELAEVVGAVQRAADPAYLLLISHQSFEHLSTSMTSEGMCFVNDVFNMN